MLKNSATKLWVYCWTAADGLPKTGDAANLTAYVSLDFDTTPDAIADTSATELSNTNAKGWYLFDLAQGETNGDINLYTCKSSTAGVVCIAVPAVVHALPTTGILAPAVAGRTLAVDASGIADANVEEWNTTAVPAEHTAGYPIVTVKDGTGTGEINTNAGAIALVDLVTTTTTVTNLHASAATAAELAKVPKSDSNVTWNATALASIQSEANDALVAYDPPTHAELTSEINDVQADIAALNNLSASAAADAVWDEACSGHTTNGTYGKAFSGATNVFLASGIAGTINTLDALDTAQDSQHATTQAAVADVPTNSELATALAAADDAVLAAIAALNNLSAAQVNAEVLDVLNVDTFAQPAQGAPGATVTLVTQIGFLYKSWRNKTTQTSSQYSLYNDDAATVDHKATVSDDATTFTKGEVASGP